VTLTLCVDGVADLCAACLRAYCTVCACEHCQEEAEDTANASRYLLTVKGAHVIDPRRWEAAR
jgi:hypothetical protein